MTALPDSSRPMGARAAVMAAALMLAGSFTGCAPADTGLQRGAAVQLQERVLGVSQAAAANDHAAALAGLVSLEADVATAVRFGQVSEDRRRTIVTSIAAVRADLTAAVEAAAAAAKAAEEAAAAAAAAAAAKAAEEAAAAAAAAEAEKAKADAEAAAAAAQVNVAPVVVPAPAPVQAPAPARGSTPDQGKGKEDKGKGK
ncbi:MAG: hypothetical protein ABWY04_19470 [Arthrobacter sp.]